MVDQRIKPNEDAKLDYNPMDDIHFYIMNDDDFYRQLLSNE